jgi:hypothetical protein
MESWMLEENIETADTFNSYPQQQRALSTQSRMGIFACFIVVSPPTPHLCEEICHP